jgi:hypothetical protein
MSEKPNRHDAHALMLIDQALEQGTFTAELVAPVSTRACSAPWTGRGRPPGSAACFPDRQMLFSVQRGGCRERIRPGAAGWLCRRTWPNPLPMRVAGRSAHA